ncbi:unnamed protein product [Symbiodinium microadriaticum]|nr:unnamed protein product [Symbiodinium microadriaticum]
MTHCSMGCVTALVAALVLWTLFSLQLRWHELAALTAALGLMDPGPIRLKVLMVRTIGGKEVEFTKDDIRSLAKKTIGIQTANTSHCAARKPPGLIAKLRRNLPLDQWPADVVCYAGITQLQIDLHVILLVWEDKIRKLDTSDLPLNVSVIFAPKSRKIDAWLSHLTATALSTYDYLWLADGDVSVSAANWFAFWANMLYYRPQIAQPAVVAEEKAKIHVTFHQKGKAAQDLDIVQTRGSDHVVLQIPGDEPDVWAIDPSLVAADVGIIEIMTPVLTPTAWLALREDLLRNSKAMHWIAQGATWCVDVKWCDLARTTVLGLEAAGEPDLSIEAAAQKLPGEQQGESREPSACMVFYQTPVRHHNFQSLKKSMFEQKNNELCGELAVGLRNTTLRRVYRTFHESDLRASSLAKTSPCQADFCTET